MADDTLLVMANRDGRYIAGAINFIGGDTLYGRHWGCATDYHSLHFETCYYAGMEYCIEHGLACFDAGAQGEHKIRRGFEPAPTWSSHVIADPRLAGAVEDFVNREAEMMAAYEHQQRTRSNFADDTAPAS